MPNHEDLETSILRPLDEWLQEAACYCYVTLVHKKGKCYCIENLFVSALVASRKQQSPSLHGRHRLFCKHLPITL